MKPYRLARRADDALDAIADEIAEDNPAAAARVVAALYETFESLARLPGSGRRRDDLRSGLRVFPARRPAHNYVILYYDGDEALEIDAVVHGARDWEDMVLRGEFDD